MHENFVVKVRPEMPLATAALIGCGVTTGVGAVMNTAKVRPGETVAVIGCGGIGLNAIQAAAIVGAGRVIAVDRVASKLELARTYEPADARYLENHRGHLMFVKPAEQKFVTAELIRRTSFTATEPVVIERIAALGDAGYTQFTVQIVPGQEAAVEDWARVKAAVAGSRR